MKAYLASNTIPGCYGARVFIPYEHWMGPVLIANLKKLSMWGGHDKDTGKCIGYEFGAEQYVEVQKFLKEYGFTLEEQSEANAELVWK